MIGRTVTHYRVLRQIGAGGMGVVYLAEDLRLQRKVALKFLPPAVALDPHTKARFTREAQAASALDHPHVATVYEISEWEGQPFIAMAFYDGETVRQRLERGSLTIAEAAMVARQLATGLAAAHAAGIVHRDLKPANVILTHEGQAKILDFGIARIVTPDTETATRFTNPGATVGTAAYMSPEQARGEDVDERTDIWAFGVVLYEILTGRLPFHGSQPAAVLMSILSDSPMPIREARPDVPAEIEHILERALVKDRAARTIRATDIASELQAYETKVASDELARARAAVSWRRPPAIAAIVLALLLAAGWLGWSFYRDVRERDARRTLIDIERLIDGEKFVEAFVLARQVQSRLDGDPTLARLWALINRPTSIQTDPPNADIYFQDYNAPADAWIFLGRSPLENVAAPNGYLRWRVDKPGFTSAHGAPFVWLAFPTARFSFRLFATDDAPDEMVYVEPQEDAVSLYIPGLDHLPPVPMPGFWIDRHEVTNREFKQFVDASGYTKPEYWQHAFSANGRSLTRQDAMALFRDATGRQGPATWELGNYPDGRADDPVTGVSWFEAAAYAAFVGKTLPTIYHWSMAAEQRSSAWVIPASNFSGRELAAAGRYRGMNAYGTFDMAGNVKEWCRNLADRDKRYILGGAWDEPAYMFADADARDPFERRANFGFRGIREASEEPAPAAAARMITFEARDYSVETPVGDDVFAAYRGQYSYDRTDLAPKVERVENDHADWKREKVTFAAAYGGERVIAYVYLPKRRDPPYQTVIFFPGAGPIYTRSSQTLLDLREFDFLIKSGRALVYPVYKGTYERGGDLQTDYPSATSNWRDHVIMWSKDLARTIDYLETRPELDRERLAYVGLSWGAQQGALLPALESRLKTLLLVAGGFPLQKTRPEVDPINFAPRITVSTLMLSGRYDFFYPSASSQEPMFRLLGTPTEHKRRIIYEAAHDIPRHDLIRESLDWLDRYLGPVR
jgi:formylglycine-generating enzyme required for sulfatase activity/dienelactone hydrolase